MTTLFQNLIARVGVTEEENGKSPRAIDLAKLTQFFSLIVLLILYAMRITERAQIASRSLNDRR